MRRVDHRTNVLPTDRQPDRQTNGHSQLKRCFGVPKKYLLNVDNTLNRVRITINFSFGSGIFVYEKSRVTASAYRDLRKLNIKRKNFLFFYNPFFHLMNVSYE